MGISTPRVSSSSQLGDEDSKLSPNFGESAFGSPSGDPPEERGFRSERQDKSSSSISRPLSVLQPLDAETETSVANFMDDFMDGFGGGETNSDEDDIKLADAEHERVTLAGGMGSLTGHIPAIPAPKKDPVPWARAGKSPEEMNKSSAGAGAAPAPSVDLLGGDSSEEEETSEKGGKQAASTPAASTTTAGGSRSTTTSPYAFHTGEVEEVDLLSSVRGQRQPSPIPPRQGKEVVSPTAAGRSMEQRFSREDVDRIIEESLTLYREDKVIAAGDLLTAHIDRTKLHETYCRERPELAQLLNRYYVIWTARRTLDAINTRRHVESIEEARAAEFNRVRKIQLDKKWREESWFSPQAYSWFKKAEEDGKNEGGAAPVPSAQPEPRHAPEKFDMMTARASNLDGGESEADIDEYYGSPTPKTVEPVCVQPANAQSGGGIHPQLVQQNSATAKLDISKYSTWDLEKEHDGIRVATSPDVRYRDANDESSRIYSSVVEGKVDLEFFPLLSMLNEVDLYPAWMEASMGGRLEKCEVLERVSRTNFVVRMLFSLPWPMAYRKVTFRVLGYDCLNREDKVKQFAIILEDVSLKEERLILGRNPFWNKDQDTVYEGSVRARIQNSCLLITPSGTPGETWLQCYVNIIPRMRSMPAWALDAGHKNFAAFFISMLRGAKQVTRQAIYRDRQMDPNNRFYSWLKARVRKELPWERCPGAVTMGGIAPQDIETVRTLVQKAAKIHADSTAVFKVGEKEIVVTTHGKSSKKKVDLYEEDSCPDDVETSSSDEDEGFSLLPEDQLSPTGSSLANRTASLPTNRTASKSSTTPRGDVVQLVSDPSRQLSLSWALNYVKTERRVTVLNVVEGMKVRRGLHWKYGDEDLGVTPAGKYGVVTKLNLAEGICKVEWKQPAGWVTSGQTKVGKYRLGPVFFDLAIYEDEVQAALSEMMYNQMQAGVDEE